MFLFSILGRLRKKRQYKLEKKKYLRKRVLESLSKAFGIWLLILWLWKKTCLECKCVFLEVAPPKLIKEVLQGNTKNSRRASVLRYGSSQSHPIKIDVTISIGINCGKQFWLCSFNQGQLEKGNDREIVVMFLKKPPEVPQKLVQSPF